MSKVTRYYRKKESKWGYKLILGGIRHFGYYPQGRKITHKQAMVNMMDEVGKRLNLPKGSKVMDAGCGEGKTALRLADKFKLRVVGVDLLEESINIAKENTNEQNVSFKVCDFQKLPFPDNEFDGVFALETFTHAQNPQKAITEFTRVLKPGGKLVIFDYETTPLMNISDKKMRKSMIAISEGTSAPGFINYNHGFFKKFLVSNNYKNVQVENLTVEIVPMLRYFRKLAVFVHPFVRFLNSEHIFPSTAAGAIGLKAAQNG